MLVKMKHEPTVVASIRLPFLSLHMLLDKDSLF